MATSSLSGTIDVSFCKKVGAHYLSTRCAILVGLFLVVPAFSQTIIESRQTYELVADATMQSLPDELAAWFIDDDAMNSALFSTKQDRVNIRIDKQSGQNHFSWLKEDSPDEHTKQRRTKNASPFSIVAVEDQSHTIIDMIQKQHAALLEAFQQGDVPAAATSAGELLHLVIDASLPSHVVVVGHEWRGRSDSQFGKQIEKLSSVESELLKKTHERFVFELRVWPGRLVQVHDIPKSVLASLVQASEAAATIRNDEAMHLRGQLEASVLLSGSLIRSAWQEAGSPGHPLQAAEAKGTSVSRSSRQNTTSKSKFVGSKQSKIFHLRTCPHVKRIKPANLVHFDSVVKVRAIGRKACKACKPNQ